MAWSVSDGKRPMKGVILAGGSGSRLYPLTRITNKHLLPVYDKPMIFYPIETLVRAGIHDIMVVTGGNNAGDFLRLLGNGRDFGLKHMNFAYQDGEVHMLQAEIPTVSQQAEEITGVIAAGDDHDVVNARPHQCLDRIEDHRFVVDGKQ